ncbi:MAG: penicillin-binding protein 2 [Candidatus Pacebacteria bacterium]|nr:penicillin-binding protein 2 [Candidatus Paceibacterota bacterium]
MSMNFFIKGRIKEIEIEDVFLDKLAQQNERTHFVSSKKLEVPLDKNGFFSLLVFGFVIFGFLAGFTFYLQAQGKDKYESLAQQNKFINFNLTAERGIIYDRDMVPLVKNESTFNLWLKKSELPANRANEIIGRVVPVLGQPASFFRDQLETAAQDDILIEKNLNHQQLVLLSAIESEIPGFKIQKTVSRKYETPRSLSHILGYLGKISQDEIGIMKENNYEFSDSIGKEGVEGFYESILRENKGIVKFEKTAQGKIISQEVVQYPGSGKSLVLAINSKMQKKSEEALVRVLRESGASKGAVVILDSSNGEILTSVSWPSFDNNLFAGGISQSDFEKLNQDKNNPQLNRVIAGLYPTGSSIKPVMGTAALEEGIITENTSLYCPAKLCVVHQYDEGADCYPDNAYHGTTDIKKAIAESVNPFFFMIGGGYTAPSASSPYFDSRLPKNFEGLGILKIDKYLNLFGFGAKTMIDLPGEAEGRVPTPEWKEQYFSTPLTQKWYLGDTYNLSIGQGYFLATPLQLAQAYVPIANKGRMFQPKVAKEILTAEGAKEDIPPVLIKENFISSSTLRIIRQGMRQTVASPSGSAYYLSDLPVAVAAKTGTAQIYPKKEIYENWLAVFAPYGESAIAEKKPPIVMVILVEEVPGVQRTAQNVAREILQWYYGSQEPSDKSSRSGDALAPAMTTTTAQSADEASSSSTSSP